MDKLQFAYTKRRSEFGRPCTFVDRATELDVSVLPQTELAEQFIRRNPVDVKCDDGIILSEHETNTNYTEWEAVGMNHTEGGWPKDISPNDIDQTTRYRRKMEKEENYISQVSRISQEMEHCILQSNAVDIYQQYFDEDCLYRDDPPVPHAKVISNYRDPTEVTRPVSQIVWHPDGPGRIAVAHCVLTFQGHTPLTSLDCYVWRTEDIFNPELVLSPTAPVLCLRYNPKDASVLAGGQYNGQVVIWDLRKGSRPTEQTALPVRHKDPVYDVTWVQSKAGTECFSTSTDGQVLWWDTRNMDQPIDQMYIDASRKNDSTLAEGGTCLEYDVTVPTKFMVGTEQGNVFVCSRRAKTPGEKVVTVYSAAQTGPVCALRRNPIYSKYFLTVGDWTAKVWSEDCKDSPLLWTTKYSEYLTDGCWSPTRPSVFFVTKTDGTFDVWDLMFRQKSAEYSVKVSDDALQCISIQEQGQMMCVGTDGGATVMLQLSEGLVALQRNERLVFSAILERETKREKILEGKERERKLLQKKTMEDEEKKSASAKPPADAICESNKIFFDIIDKEKTRLQKENAKFTQYETKKLVPESSRSQLGVARSKEAFKIEEEEPEESRKTPEPTRQQEAVQQAPIVTATEPEAAATAGEPPSVDATTVPSKAEGPSVEPSSGPIPDVVISEEPKQQEAEPAEKKADDEPPPSAPPAEEASKPAELNLVPVSDVVMSEEPVQQEAKISQSPEPEERKAEDEALPSATPAEEASEPAELNLVPASDVVMSEEPVQQETKVSQSPEPEERKADDEALPSAPPAEELSTSVENNLTPVPDDVISEEPEQEVAKVSPPPESDERADDQDKGEPMPLAPPPEEVNVTAENNLNPVPDVVVDEEPEQQEAKASQSPEPDETKAGEETFPSVLPAEEISASAENNSTPVPEVVISEEPEQDETKVSQPEGESIDVTQEQSSSAKESEEQPTESLETAQD